MRGRDLNGYLATGIRTDHECTSAAEAQEKLAKGMTVLIRESSVCKDLHALLPIITERNSPHICFCTDDRNPVEIAAEGHLDFSIRTAIAGGAPPLAVYRAASISAARTFGLRDRGLVAPGYRADLVVLDDLDTCKIARVLSAGRLVDDALFAGRPHVEPVGRRSVKARQVTAADFAAPASSLSTAVIGVVPGKVITERLAMTLPLRDGCRQIDLDQDACKVAVVARHGVNDNIAVAFVRGFGMRRGAIASSVGHDSHNLCVVGADEDDMAVAIVHAEDHALGGQIDAGDQRLDLSQHFLGAAAQQAIIPKRVQCWVHGDGKTNQGSRMEASAPESRAMPFAAGPLVRELLRS